MLNMQAVRPAMVALPQAIENNQTVPTLEIDTVVNGVKADYITYYIMLGATDTTFTTLKNTETDVSGNGYTDTPGAAFGGTAKDGVTANPPLPGALDDFKIFAIHIKLSGSRKRFHKLSAVLGAGSTGAFVTIMAVLSRLHELPATSAKRNIAGEIIA